MNKLHTFLFLYFIFECHPVIASTNTQSDIDDPRSDVSSVSSTSQAGNTVTVCELKDKILDTNDYLLVKNGTFEKLLLRNIKLEDMSKLELPDTLRDVELELFFPLPVIQERLGSFVLSYVPEGHTYEKEINKFAQMSEQEREAAKANIMETVKKIAFHSCDSCGVILKPNIVPYITHFSDQQYSNLLMKVSIINLAANDIDDDGIKKLAPSLGHMTSLISLNLNGNKISETGIVYLADALQKLTTLKKLNLSVNQIKGNDRITDESIQAFFKVLASIENLDLSSNRLGDAGVMVLALGLSKSSSLTILNLSRNEITDQGAKSLIEAVRNGAAKLTELKLSCNRLGDTAAIAFASVLAEPSTLTILDLYFNEITDKGVMSLIEAVRNGATKLRELNLEGNKITNKNTELRDALEALGLQRPDLKLLINSDERPNTKPPIDIKQ